MTTEKADITRSTFRKEKHCSKVNCQQGRISLDSDWNEQNDINIHHERTCSRDFIGSFGAPIETAGFSIIPNDKPLFNWNNLLSTDSDKLLDFLKNDLNIDWIDMSAKIEKAENSDTIKTVTNEAGALSITLDNIPTQATKATVSIGEEVVYEFIVRVEGGVPNVYQRWFTLGKGRIYVNGIMCENEKNIDFSKQPDFPLVKGKSHVLPSEFGITRDGIYLVYLDVWERHITKEDDPEIQESALGEADTTTRTQVVCQARIIRAGNITDIIDCDSIMKLFTEPAKTPSGTVQIRAKATQEISEQCSLQPDAKYRGPKNRLYRIEIHEGGTIGGEEKPTFKWSKNNAALQYVKLMNISEATNVLTVASIEKKDAEHSFKTGQWIEITDDFDILRNQQGAFVKIAEVNYEENKIVLSPETVIGKPITNENFPQKLNPKVRGWDSQINSMQGLMVAEIPAPNDGYLEIDDGIQIKFAADGSYKRGDCCVAPARKSKADVEWPLVGPMQVPQALPMEEVTHHSCPLALIQYKDSIFTVKSDCRVLFPPATLPHKILYYVSGDGQEAESGKPLPHPIMVGVARGSTPVKAAKVRFTIVAGGGSLDSQQDGIKVIDLLTNDVGLVNCPWKIGDSGRQQAKAVMLDDNNKETHLPVFFNANIKTPIELANTGLLRIRVDTSLVGKTGVFGPFSHSLQNLQVPPAIILGLDSVPSDAIPSENSLHSMEDFRLLPSVIDRLPLFKAMVIDKESFKVFLDLKFVTDVNSPIFTKGVILRWWAIPALNQKIQTWSPGDSDQIIEIKPLTISIGAPLNTFKIMVIDPNMSTRIKAVVKFPGLEQPVIVEAIEKDPNSGIFVAKIEIITAKTIKVNDQTTIDLPQAISPPGEVIAAYTYAPAPGQKKTVTAKGNIQSPQ